jgi:molecular chaperone HscC
VAPYSMGIAISRQVGADQYEGGHFLPIIERNSTVPVSRSHPVGTIRDNQTEIMVAVYQGEARLVRDNVFLGNITVPLPPKKKGEVDIEVRFTYDVSGVLEAEVLLPQTGERYRAIISDNSGVLSPEQIEQRFIELAGLKIHPRDQIENRALVTRADRLYEQALGDLRHYLADCTARFQAALDTQDPVTVRRVRSEFKALLDQVESDHAL